MKTLLMTFLLLTTLNSFAQPYFEGMLKYHLFSHRNCTRSFDVISISC